MLGETELSVFLDQLEIGAESGYGFAALFNSCGIDYAKAVLRLLQIFYAGGVDAHDAAAGGVYGRQV